MDPQKKPFSGPAPGMEASKTMVPQSPQHSPSRPNAYMSSFSSMPLDGRSRHERAKFSSPAPPSSSMTPPPSSQLHQFAQGSARTPTPPTPSLTSPPLTSRHSSQVSNHGEPGTTAQFTAEQVNTATIEELRAMVNDLTLSLKDARISASHYKLQYQMLCLDSTEATNRMAVELHMTQREVEVLQEAQERRRTSVVTPEQSFTEAPNPANAILVSELNRKCQVLQSENEELKGSLEQSRKLADHRQGQVVSLTEENDRLRGRIRKNREHMNGLLGNLNEKSPTQSGPATSRNATPRHRAKTLQTIGEGGNHNQQAFEALLLADKMLSTQNTTTAPSTPRRILPPKPRAGHTRGTHSMSSLPVTPTQNRFQGLSEAAVFRTPSTTFAAINVVPQSAPPVQYQPKHFRRESSDSTITASSVGDEDHGSENDDIPESQASLAASTILRRASQKSQVQVPTSPSPARPPVKLVQSKIYGHVRKSGMPRNPEQEKRRISTREPTDTSPSKRSRIDNSVGLGIGGLLSDA